MCWPRWRLKYWSQTCKKLVKIKLLNTHTHSSSSQWYIILPTFFGYKIFNIYWINDDQFKGGQCSYKQETLWIIYSASHTKYDSYDKRNKGGQSLCVWGNRALFIFVDTTCSVCCAWAMPVYTSVKVNSGAGKERCLTSLTCWDNALKTSLCIIPHRLKKCVLFKGCWKHCDPGSTWAGNFKRNKTTSNTHHMPHMK